MLINILKLLTPRRDKDNLTLTLNKAECVSEIKLLLSDKNLYEVKKDPTKKIINNLKTNLNRWINNSYFNKEIYNRLLMMIAKAYGLPKLHNFQQLYDKIKNNSNIFI